MLSRLLDRLRRSGSWRRSHRHKRRPLGRSHRAAGPARGGGLSPRLAGGRAHRVLGAARAARADAIVEITGDCPLVDAGIVDAAARRLQQGDVDYVANILNRLTFPIGLDVQVYRTDLLEEIAGLTQTPTTGSTSRPHLPPRRALPDREPGAPPALHRPGYRLCVDHAEDLALVSTIYQSSTPQTPPSPPQTWCSSWTSTRPCGRQHGRPDAFECPQARGPVRRRSWSSMAESRGARAIVGCGRIAGGYNDADERAVLTHAWPTAGWRRRWWLLRPGSGAGRCFAAAGAWRTATPTWRRCWPTPTPGGQRVHASRRPAEPCGPSWRHPACRRSYREAAGHGAAAAQECWRCAGAGRPVLVNFPAPSTLQYPRTSGGAGAAAPGPGAVLRHAITNASHWLERSRPASAAAAVRCLGGSATEPAFALDYPGGALLFCPARDAGLPPSSWTCCSPTTGCG